jgi:hypothetical protein
MEKLSRFWKHEQTPLAVDTHGRILVHMETQSYTEQVAGEVRAAIARANLTQSAVCAMTGIKGATMSRKLSGKVAFDVEELHLIADALGLVAFELMPRTRPAAATAQVAPLAVAS